MTTDRRQRASNKTSPPPSPREEAPVPLHPHLPKPPHDWRTLVGEVAVIVIGILIALSAEEVLSSVHERHDAAEAEEVIRGEIGYNLGRLRLRLQTRPCIDRRIAEIQRILDNAAARPDIATPNWIGRPIYSTFERNRWEAESGAARTALIDKEKLSNYAVIYAQMENIESEMKIEQTDWAKLRSLEHLRRLDQPALFDLNASLQDARYRAWRIALLITRSLDLQKALEIRETFNRNPASDAVCLPITTTRKAANDVSVFPFGEP